MAFGIPGELMNLLDQAWLDSLWAVLDSAGGDVDAGLDWADAQAAEGVIAPVIAAHLRAWNDAKRSGEATYLLTYAAYCDAHAADWARDGLTRPDDSDMLDIDPAQQPVRVNKVGRNCPCPCGSGAKYKRCCGA